MLASMCMMQPGCFPPVFVVTMIVIIASLIGLSGWVAFVTLRWIGRTVWPESHISDRVEPGA